ncbi:MAG: xanthine dehydrogenase family protein subunit M [Nocardiopsaceae bacterium]|nr:xanthine dehydrogenase family protein subunit M [Nocardiopsaceae bacterium]
MYTADFAYARAGSLAGALELLAAAQARGEDVKLLAGGQSLLPMMKLRLAAPETLIDIGGVGELKGVTGGPAEGAEGAKTVIGALTTYRELERDPMITATFPAMADALAVLADSQVRARGTIGGCIAHADPASDLPAVLLALDATVTIAGGHGTREALLDDFLTGIYSTDLADDEIITAITVPAAPPGQAYEKFPQPASHLPLAGACAAVEIKDGTICRAGVAVTGVASRPYRPRDTERILASAPLTPSLLASAAAQAGGAEQGGDVRPLSDQHASGPYRLHLAEIMTLRALQRAVERASGNSSGKAGER